jgi:hypothetical protein
MFDAAIILADLVLTVSATIADNTGNGGAGNSIKVLRCFRALRPLRVIKRFPGLRNVVNCFLSSLPQVMQTLAVVTVWFFFFGMIGVNFFKGTTYYCFDPQQHMYYGYSQFQSGSLYTEVPSLSGPEAVPTIIECVTAGASGSNGVTGGLGVWQPKQYSFDTVWEAVLTLFEMSTTEGWLDVMASTVDAVQPGVTPIPNFMPEASWFSILHIVLGSFICLNLIIGTVISNYIKIKNAENIGELAMNEQQQGWKATLRLMLMLKPRQRCRPPKHPLRSWCFTVVSHRSFDWLIFLVILGSICTLMLKTHDSWSSYNSCWDADMFIVNLVFTWVFVIEFGLKVLALGPVWYFVDWWNRFDLFILLLSVASVGIDVSTGEHMCLTDASTVQSGSQISGLRVLRVIRLVRVFRLVRRAKGLQQMIRTLAMSIPQLGNIIILILIIMIIFSVLTTTFFFNVTDTDAVVMDTYYNYNSVGNSLILLFRFTTGESWNSFMHVVSDSDVFHACSKAYGEYINEGCGDAVPGSGGHKLLSRLVSLTWVVMATLMLMQVAFCLFKSMYFICP